jgi:glutathione synthase/RimK-type ligase-like ATP-grasp enzyme
MTIWITSGDRPSNSRRALQLEGGFRLLKTGKGLKKGDTIINWGCGNPDHIFITEYLNYPTKVRLAANKLQSFQAFKDHDVSSVPWTTSQEEVKEWLKKYHVVARTVLTGHSGDGIIIIEPETEEVPKAPLYTRYIMKTHEYRVHVVKESVVDVQRKIRDPERDPSDWKVRSHANGFIFVRQNVVISDAIRDLAVQSIGALGLDFGAVDIVVDKDGVAYVLEVNTAPGLEGQTVQSYSQALRAVCS